MKLWLLVIVLLMIPVASALNYTEAHGVDLNILNGPYASYSTHHGMELKTHQYDLHITNVCRELPSQPYTQTADDLYLISFTTPGLNTRIEWDGVYENGTCASEDIAADYIVFPKNATVLMWSWNSQPGGYYAMGGGSSSDFPTNGTYFDWTRHLNITVGPPWDFGYNTVQFEVFTNVTFEVLNDPPAVSALYVSEVIGFEDTIQGGCNASDENGDSMNTSYRWFQDGIVVDSGNATGDNLLTNLTGFSGGEEVILECSAVDWQNTTTVNGSTIIVQGPPVMQEAEIIPGSVKQGVEALGWCNGTDNTSSTISYNYAWYKNGVEAETGFSPSYDQGELTQIDAYTAHMEGDELIFSCQANDGTYTSSFLNSTPITIQAPESSGGGGGDFPEEVPPVVEAPAPIVVPVEEPAVNFKGFYESFIVLWQKIFAGDFKLAAATQVASDYSLELFLTVAGLGLLVMAGRGVGKPKKGKKK